MRTTPRSTSFRCTAGLALALAGSNFGCDTQDDAEPTQAEQLVDDAEPAALDVIAEIPDAAEPSDEAPGPMGPTAFGIERDPLAFTFKGWANDTYPPVTCGTGQIASGAGCHDNCTYVGLECHNYGGSLGESRWSNFISEEAPNNFYLCPGNQYVTGFTCTGGWCDNVSVECTETSFAKNSCYWTGPITSTIEYLPDTGHAVAGVQCEGGHCSTMRFYVCSI